MANKYPTKKEILSPKIDFKDETIECLKKWKPIWIKNRNKNTKIKIETIGLLIINLTKIYEKTITIRYDPSTKSSYYNSKKETIVLNKPSILTALHEFAHHIKGPSEKKACRWSVQLFKIVFYKSYKQLNWKGHMLIK